MSAPSTHRIQYFEMMGDRAQAHRNNCASQ